MIAALEGGYELAGLGMSVAVLFEDMMSTGTGIDLRDDAPIPGASAAGLRVVEASGRARGQGE